MNIHFSSHFKLHKRLLTTCLVTALTCFGGSEWLLRNVATAQSTPEGVGNIRLEYLPSDNKTYSQINHALRTTQLYDGLVKGLNQSLDLPSDILVTFKECGDANAFYDPAKAQVVMCYELIQILAKAAYSGDELSSDAYAYSGLFTFLHELGHALVDQYQLPITGREEDTADSFAAVLLIRMRWDTVLVAALNQFESIASVEDKSGTVSYWNEHPFTRQRIYNVACLLYGSAPDTYQPWVSEEHLPAERAKLCPNEYAQADRSWGRLLAPHVNLSSQ